MKDIRQLKLLQLRDSFQKLRKMKMVIDQEYTQEIQKIQKIYGKKNIEKIYIHKETENKC